LAVKWEGFAWLWVIGGLDPHTKDELGSNSQVSGGGGAKKTYKNWASGKKPEKTIGLYEILSKYEGHGKKESPEKKYGGLSVIKRR